MLNVQILLDNPQSWMMEHAQNLHQTLMARGVHAKVIHRHDEVIQGDILLLLSCEKLFKPLHLNKHNLIAHSSDLPKGRGWSPLTWQILEGKNQVPVTLFEATPKVDEGVIYEQEFMTFEGHELIGEMQRKQGEKINELVLKFLDKYPNNKGVAQSGNPSFYRKRTADDSELATDQSLEKLFNLMRVCDPDRYPSFFYIHGQKYYLKIAKSRDEL